MLYRGLSALVLSLLVLASPGSALKGNNIDLSSLHLGMAITDKLLWDECYMRYKLDMPLLSACSRFDCGSIDHLYFSEEAGACWAIREQAEKDTSNKNKNKSNSKDLHLELPISYQDLKARFLGNRVSESLKSLYVNSFQRIINSNEALQMQRVKGKEFVAIEDKQVQIVRPRKLIDDGQNSNSTNLSDWEPVSDIIGQNETKYYQFNVNTTSTGLSSFYHILIFLSGNICTLPKDVGSNNQLIVDYGFDVNIVTNFSNATYNRVIFSDGYMEGLAKHDIPSNPNNTFVTLYTKVSAPATKNASDIWNYVFGISQKDLIYQWDNKTWISMVDSDDTSALLVTGNFTQADSLNLPEFNSTDRYNYEVYLYPYNANIDYFGGLSSSWCAIRNGPTVLSSATGMDISFTNRSRSLRQQFYVPHLNKSTEYMGYALQTNSKGNYGGTVFKPMTFKTKSDSACQLIYNLDFCENVAYSVPAMQNGSASAEDNFLLKSLYDNNTKSLYQNFKKALSQVACETEPDARYSPIRTCDHCAKSYKDWLCAVTIPRCTTDSRDEYVKREPNTSRSLFVNEQINPATYYEILPCYNSCYAIVRDCPAVFSFGCPENTTAISNSTYYWDAGQEYITCNFVGSSVKKSWAAALVANYKLLLSCMVLAFSLFI